MATKNGTRSQGKKMKSIFSEIQPARVPTSLLAEESMSETKTPEEILIFKEEQLGSETTAAVFD